VRPVEAAHESKITYSWDAQRTKAAAPGPVAGGQLFVDAGGQRAEPNVELVRERFAEMLRGGGLSPEALYREFDENRDGKISWSEFCWSIRWRAPGSNS
jgi:hypothetical protein